MERKETRNPTQATQQPSWPAQPAPRSPSSPRGPHSRAQPNWRPLPPRPSSLPLSSSPASSSPPPTRPHLTVGPRAPPQPALAASLANALAPLVIPVSFAVTTARAEPPLRFARTAPPLPCGPDPTAVPPVIHPAAFPSRSFPTQARDHAAPLAGSAFPEPGRDPRRPFLPGPPAEIPGAPL